jgi:hypothetical protein
MTAFLTSALPTEDGRPSGLLWSVLKDRPDRSEYSGYSSEFYVSQQQPPYGTLVLAFNEKSGHAIGCFVQRYKDRDYNTSPVSLEALNIAEAMQCLCETLQDAGDL